MKNGEFLFVGVHLEVATFGFILTERAQTNRLWLGQDDIFAVDERSTQINA